MEPGTRQCDGPVGKGMRVPLSEEEQRILQEMEQKLREHDRDFVERVSHTSYRLRSSRGAKWAAFAFAAGTVLLLGTFQSSTALGVCGVVVMFVAALVFAQQVSGGPPRAVGEEAPDELTPPSPRVFRHPRPGSLAEEWSEMRRRMRARFGHRG